MLWVIIGILVLWFLVFVIRTMCQEIAEFTHQVLVFLRLRKGDEDD